VLRGTIAAEQPPVRGTIPVCQPTQVAARDDAAAWWIRANTSRTFRFRATSPSFNDPRAGVLGYHNLCGHWLGGLGDAWAYTLFRSRRRARLIRWRHWKVAKRRAHAGGKLDVQEGEMFASRTTTRFSKRWTKSGRTAAFISTPRWYPTPTAPTSAKRVNRIIDEKPVRHD